MHPPQAILHQSSQEHRANEPMHPPQAILHVQLGSQDPHPNSIPHSVQLHPQPQSVINPKANTQLAKQSLSMGITQFKTEHMPSTQSTSL